MQIQYQITTTEPAKLIMWNEEIEMPTKVKVMRKNQSQFKFAKYDYRMRAAIASK